LLRLRLQGLFLELTLAAATGKLLSVDPQPSPSPRLGDLPRSNVEAVEHIGYGYREHERRQSALVIMPGGLVPDLVGNRVRANR